MATQIQDLINVDLSATGAAVTAAAFGEVMILGLHTVFTERAVKYSKEEIADDFLTTSQIYLAAMDAFNQKKLRYVWIGRIDAGDATVTATLTAIKDYNNAWHGLVHADPNLSEADIKLVFAWCHTNDKLFVAQTSDATVKAAATTTDVASDLKVLAYNSGMILYHDEAVAQVQTITFVGTFDAADTVTLTVEGVALGAITYATSHADMMAAIVAAIAGATTDEATVALTSANLITITATKGVDASNIPIIIPISFVIGGASTVTGTVAETVTAARNTNAAAAWIGLQLPKAPGSSNWAYKTLIGITPDVFTAAEITGLEGKNCNRYESIGGAGRTYNGITPAGGERFIDLPHGDAWLKARIAEGGLNILVNNEKIPFTNAGRDLIVNMLDSKLKIATRAPYNFLASYVIDAPDVTEVDATDKGNRIYSGITFEGTYQGAVNTITFKGTLSN